MKRFTFFIGLLLAAVAGAKQPPDPRIAALQLGQVKFREVDFNGALDYFRRKVEQQSNGALKVVFEQDLPPDFQPKHELSLDLTNIPFPVALNYLGELAGVQFTIDGTTITARSLSADSTKDRATPPVAHRPSAGPPAALPVVRAQLLTLLAESRMAAKSDANLPAARAAFHDAHRVQLRKILETNGWPGRDLVGADGAYAALSLLQEECGAAELMKLAMPLLQAAVQHQTAALSDLARLIDAERVGTGRMQVYGTQYRAALDGQPVRFPTEDLPQVDARRKLAGLPTLRAQEEAMGLVAPLPGAPAAPPRQAPLPTRLQTSAGLNSVESPMLNWIYVHSRDDGRAAGDGHAAGGGLETSPKK